MIDINRYKNDTTLKKKVLQIIYQRGKVSRGELTEIMSLSITSVVKFVGELMADGVVIERGTLESTGGRKTSLLCINPDYAYILGIDIGGFAAKIGVVRMDGTILEDWFIPEKSSTFPVIVMSLTELAGTIGNIIEKYGEDRFMAICVGISGMVDSKAGKVIFCPNISGWDNVMLADALKKEFGLPVFVDTSARCMALGEQYLGAGRGIENQIFLSLGNFDISSAIIIHSQIFRGSFGFSGEIGHVTSSNEGIRCTCGNYDCLELAATVKMIVAEIIHEIDNIKSYSPLKQMMTGRVEEQQMPALIVKAMEAGDKLCYETVMKAGKSVGIALSNLLNVLNPELVILGGGVIELFPAIMGMIRETIKERALVTVQKNMIICKSELGWRGAIAGSAMLAIIEHFS